MSSPSKKVLLFTLQKLEELPQRWTQFSFNEKLTLWMQKYEDFVGLTQVIAAQDRVLEAETKFIRAQEERREMQRQISSVQQKLQDLHAELDRIPRGDDKYLALVTQEHAVIKDERRLRELFLSSEKDEREHFAALSHAVRDSHEKERAQAEKTKYWSVIGSVLGTILGIAGSGINNRLKMGELRELVKDATVQGRSGIDLEELATRLKAIPQEPSVQQMEPIRADAAVRPSVDQLTRLTDTLVELSQDVQRKQQVILEQEQRLESLLTNLAPVEKDALKPAMTTEDFEDLLDQQRQYFGHLLIIGSILIPLTTWVMVKFC